MVNPAHLSSLESNKQKSYILDKMGEHRRDLNLAKLRNKKTKGQRLYAYCKKKIYASTVSMVPPIGIEPRRFHQRAFFLGVVFIAFSIIVFLVTLILQYSTLRTTILLQPRMDPLIEGCENVLRSINLDNMMFDKDGNWITNAEFDINTSIFKADFKSILVNQANYSALMTQLRDEVDRVKVVGNYFTLATYYAAFGTFIKEVGHKDLPLVLPDATSLLRLDTVVKPAYMFNGVTNFFATNLVSKNYTLTKACKNFPPQVINKGGIVTVTYKNSFHGIDSETQYQKNLCDEILSTEMFRISINGGDLSETFNASVESGAPTVKKEEKITVSTPYLEDIFYTTDLTSALVAMAVNLGVLAFDELSKIEISDLYLFPTVLQGYILPSFPDMQFILCNENAFSSTPLCFVYVGSSRTGMFYLPVINSFASSPIEGVPFVGLCTCENGKSASKFGISSFNQTVAADLCNGKNSMAIDLISISATPRFCYPSEPSAPLICKEFFKYSYEKMHSWVQRVQDAPNFRFKYEAFQQSVYNASSVGQYKNGSPIQDPGNGGKLRSDAFMQSYLDDAFEFCDGECFIMTLKYYGLSTTLGANSVSFLDIACSSKPFPTEKAWQNLIDNPPVPLVEEYVTCQNSKAKAFATALGLANGLLQAFMTLCALVFLPFLVYAMEFFGYIRPIPKLGEEYDTADKQLVMEELALQLLRIRDKDLRGLVKGGALDLLGNDLINTARTTSQLDTEDDGSVAFTKPEKSNLASRVSARVFLDIDEDEEGNRTDQEGIDITKTGEAGKETVNFEGINPMQAVEKASPHDQL